MESANLEPLGDAKVGVALLVVTPLKLEGGSGSPLRVLAVA
jgi:kynurenine formamidase